MFANIIMMNMKYFDYKDQGLLPLFVFWLLQGRFHGNETTSMTHDPCSVSIGQPCRGHCHKRLHATSSNTQGHFTWGPNQVPTFEPQEIIETRSLINLCKKRRRSHDLC